MTSNFLDHRVDDILESILADAGGQVTVVNPSERVLDTFVEVATGLGGGPPAVRLLAEERTVKAVMDDFIVAANAADLIAADALEIRTLSEPPENALVITEDAVIALVRAGTRVAGLATDDDAFVAETTDTYETQWAEAEPFNLRTPAISAVRETLATEIGETAETDFVSILKSLETARGNGDGLDEVTISLLVAAKNEALLYDISKWGEDVGIASKATFSRTKTSLEDKGLIETEKVPIDVGRPRLRLRLADDRLDDASSDELASVAQSILA